MLVAGQAGTAQLEAILPDQLSALIDPSPITPAMGNSLSIESYGGTYIAAHIIAGKLPQLT